MKRIAQFNIRVFRCKIRLPFVVFLHNTTEAKILRTKIPHSKVVFWSRETEPEIQTAKKYGNIAPFAHSARENEFLSYFALYYNIVYEYIYVYIFFAVVYISASTLKFH